LNRYSTGTKNSKMRQRKKERKKERQRKREKQMKRKIFFLNNRPIVIIAIIILLELWGG